MSIVVLIEGPVGAGKSTYASALAARTGSIHIALDQWFTTLFSPDRPPSDFAHWYVERKNRLISLIWNHGRQILASGSSVILELGLIQRDPRIAFYRQVRSDGYEPAIHVLDAPMEIRRERVRRRNLEQGDTFSMVVPDEIFDMASKLWESPDEIECSEFEITIIDNPSVPSGVD